MRTRIAFIGGGGLRTLGAIRDWALQGEVAAESRLCVMDLDERRATIISRLAREIPEVKAAGIEVTGTTRLEEALPGADFVYNLIRVGGVVRLEGDARIGVRHGFHGHDDFGPSAAMLVLRTVPAALRIAGEMEKHCPDAWLLNFTNPVPYIVRAVHDFSKIRVFGLCGGDRNQLYDIPTTLGWPHVPCRDLQYRGVGLDHFSWSTELTFQGRDFYPELLAAARTLDRKKQPYYCRMSLEVLETYGQWLSSSAHCFHWTHHDEMLERLRLGFAEQDNGCIATRADRQEKMMDEAATYVGQELDARFWDAGPLASHIQHTPGFPAIGVKAMSSMLANRGDEMMVSAPAPGAVGNLPGDGVLLISCRLFRDGPQPLHFAGVPQGVAPLTRQLLAHQAALTRVAVQGGRRELESAFLVDPMFRDITRLRAMLDELLAANRGMVRPGLLT